jgi:O-antigen ligase|tara:strand:- start:4834 stop:6405 length:1572 start_codon:yes stop_codon:yes gene_type:complete
VGVIIWSLIARFMKRQRLSQIKRILVRNKTIVSSVPGFILLFCSVLFADFLPSAFGAYADQRILLSLSLVVVVALGLVRMFCRRGEGTSALQDMWPFSLLVFSFCFAALQYRLGPFYFIEPVFYTLYFLAFGITGYLIRAEQVARDVSLAFVTVAAVACFFYAAMTITVYLFAINDNFSRLDRIIPWGFVNIRYWSHIATWVIPLFPLALLITPFKESRLWRLGVSFSAAVWWWILFMSSSRGSMVGLFVGFILVWVCFGKTASPWVKLFARFAIYGLIAWFVLSLIIPSLVFDEIQVRGVKGHSSGRIPLWREALAMSLQHFPFGMGPQAWITHETLTDGYHASPKLGHPHNMYLMWAAEYGWISIVGLVVLCGFALRCLLCQIYSARVGDNPDALYLIAFAASVTAALVHAGVSAVFIAPGSMLIGLPMLTIFWALIKPESRPPRVCDSGKRPQLLISAGPVVMVVFLIASSYWFHEVLKYRQAMSDDLPYYQEEVGEGYLPRFWFHGNFPRPLSQMPPEQ